nr:uncharacterized protein K02A2.6-like [Aedes albopictus]
MANAELMEALSAMIAQALRASIGNVVEQVNAGQQAGDAAAPSPKVPPFTMPQYRSSEETSVADYFNRFEWALQLSLIPEAQYANFARVHMGAELNNALKFLVTPREPSEIPYTELRTTLENHFDRRRNKFVESVKFRHIVQQKGESVSQFALRLKQGAAYCEYGEFLDRMLIEQLLHGLEARDICDEIIAKSPTTFKDAYDIAHALEATRNTAREINMGTSPPYPEAANKLGYEKPRTKKSQPRHRSPSFQQKQYANEPRSESEEKPRAKTYPNSAGGSSSCNGCGGQHLRSQCRFRDARCNVCNKKGHIARVQSRETPASEVDLVQSLNQVSSVGKKMIDVGIDGRHLQMELDTGAPCGIVGESTLRKIKPKFSLLPTDRQFSSYTGHRINCLGRLPVQVSVGSTTRKLNLYVVSGESDSLFGREWIAHFVEQINMNRLFSPDSSVNSLQGTELTPDQEAHLSKLLDNFDSIFSEVPGKLVGPPAKVHLKPGVSPVFARARDVPLALRDRYAAEIDKKLASGFYEKVDYSEWASPTHIVMKKNGSIRITGNYKPTVNPRMIIDEHPIPKVETLFNRMKGATLFCHLDVTDAYTHLPIDDEFRHVLTLNTTTHGLIRPTRAVYGAANIPAIWQRRMESVLQGLDNVVSFYDDVIVFAKNFDELLLALTATMDRMKQNGLRLNRSKCIFATSSLECLGHRIDRQGLHKSDKHVEAIRDAPRPATPEDLQLFLVYKPTSQNTNADYCSRIPSKSTQSDVSCLSLHEGRNIEDEFDQFVLRQVQQLPVRAEHIARETRKDPHLGKIVKELELGRNLAQSGYKAPEAKYTLAANCLLFEHRVVIPATLREAILTTFTWHTSAS